MHPISELIDFGDIDWHETEQRTLRDKIPCLGQIAEVVNRRIDVGALSVLALDDVVGGISTYLGRRGGSVTCCVAGVGEGAYLASLLQDEGLANVSVLMQARSQRGTPVLPFLTRQFDAAVVVLGLVCKKEFTNSLLKETARAVKPGGLVALGLWSSPRPVGQTVTDYYQVKWTPAYVEAVQDAGFRDPTTSLLRTTCTAPSRRDYARSLMRFRVTRAEMQGEPITAPVPVPLECWGAVVVAERP
jgi:SAM-dependent methyltransferase